MSKKNRVQNNKKHHNSKVSINILAKNGFNKDAQTLFNYQSEISTKLGTGFFNDVGTTHGEIDDLFASNKEAYLVGRLNTLLNQMALKFFVVNHYFDIFEHNNQAVEPSLSYKKRGNIAHLTSMLHSLLEKHEISSEYKELLFNKINTIKLSRQNGYGYDLDYENVFPIIESSVAHNELQTIPSQKIKENIEYLKILTPPSAFELEKIVKENKDSFNNELVSVKDKYGESSDEYLLSQLALMLFFAYNKKVDEEIIQKDRKVIGHQLGIVLGQRVSGIVTLEDALFSLFDSKEFENGIDAALAGTKFEHINASDVAKWIYSVVLFQYRAVSQDFFEEFDISWLFSEEYVEKMLTIIINILDKNNNSIMSK